MARIPGIPERLNRDQAEVLLKERVANLISQGIHNIFEYDQCSVFLPVTHWCCASSLLVAVGAESGMGEEMVCLPGMLLAFIPLATEGISTVLCCTVWSHRKGSEAPAGVMCDTVAWSLGHDCCQTREQLPLPYLGVTAKEVTARPSASPHAHKHVYILYEQTRGKDQQPWSSS